MRRWALFLALAGLTACAPEKEVWFAPNLGSPDLLDLFTRPGDWSSARAQIHVYKFDSQQLIAAKVGDCAQCGRNVLPSFLSAGAFTKLGNQGIALAIDAGAIKEWGCTADVTAPVASLAIRNVEENGGRIRYLAMDEPLLGGEGCGYSQADSATVTADFVRRVAQSSPSVGIGDIEPYPRYGASTLQTWLQTLIERGVKPAFFHLDVDREDIRYSTVTAEDDLKAIESFCDSHGIPFGVIFWSNQGGSNRAYYEDTMAWLVLVGRTVGMPQHSIFQSWVEAGDGTKMTPSNLPERDSGAYAHTRLVNDGLKILRAFVTIPVS